VITVTTSFNIIMGQTAKMSRRKKMASSFNVLVKYGTLLTLLYMPVVLYEFRKSCLCYDLLLLLMLT